MRFKIEAPITGEVLDLVISDPIAALVNTKSTPTGLAYLRMTVHYFISTALCSTEAHMAVAPLGVGFSVQYIFVVLLAEELLQKSVDL